MKVCCGMCNEIDDICGPRQYINLSTAVRLKPAPIGLIADYQTQSYLPITTQVIKELKCQTTQQIQNLFRQK